MLTCKPRPGLKSQAPVCALNGPTVPTTTKQEKQGREEAAQKLPSPTAFPPQLNHLGPLILRPKVQHLGAGRAPSYPEACPLAWLAALKS